MSRIVSLSGMLAVALLGLPHGAQAAARPVHESRPAAARGTVAIDNVAGSIEVIGSDTTTIDVSGTLGERIERLEVSGPPDRLAVRVVLPRSGGGAGSEAHLKIQVPRGSAISAQLVSASYRATGVTGAQDLRTVSGAIGGTAAGSLDVETVSGSVEIAREQPGSTRMKSVSGQLRLEGALGNTTVESVSGAVRLEPSATPDAQIALSSLSGAISSCGGPAPERPRFGPGSRLEYRSGRGEARITVETTSGAIRLCPATAR